MQIVEIRRARLGDAPALARLHYQCRHETYAHIFTAPVLEDWTSEISENQWNHWLDPNNSCFSFVAQDLNGRLLGFAVAQLQSQAKFQQFDAELLAMYVKKESHHQGIGSRLMHAISQALDFNSAKSMFLWVVGKNPSVMFFRQFGGRLIAQRSIRHSHKDIIEECYGFDQLALPYHFSPRALTQGYQLDRILRQDKKAYIEHFKDREIYEHTLSFPWPYSSKDADTYLDHVLEQKISYKHEYNLAIRDPKGFLVGSVSLNGSFLDDAHAAELRFWLAREHRGHGVATRAVQMMCELSQKDYGKIRIWSRILPWAIATQRVLENNGFTQEGTLRKSVLKEGVLYDEKIYARLSPH